MAANRNLFITKMGIRACWTGPAGYGRPVRTPLLRLAVACAATAAIVLALFPPSPASAQVAGYWPTYLGNTARSGYNSAETAITASSAPSLTTLWTDSNAGAVSSEPVVAGGVVYYGSWDGLEHAVNAATGAQIWSVNLGTTSDSICDPPEAGVASSATIGSVTLNGTATTVDFVGGGDGNFYALNAATGAEVWSTSLGAPPGYFLWSSPLYYNGNIYEGVSSFGDCPLVRGEVVEMNAATGAVENTFYTVPAGCQGAGVWGSLTVDTATGDLYFATGNAIPCGSAEPLAQSFIQADSSLNMLSSWQVPATQQISDGDFGSTPTLFQTYISGVLHKMVGVENKDGYYYAFDRSSVASGPLWERKVSYGGGCPDCGRSAISPSAYNGKDLFAGGEKGKVGTALCSGDLREMRPSNGGNIWVDCLSGPVLGAITAVPGVIFAGAGDTFYAISMSTGATLWSFQDPGAGSDFYGPASISNGVVYVGNMDGTLYAFGA
jgi:polyvinyl alcohol dehydrogenase (cytochrome)